MNIPRFATLAILCAAFLPGCALPRWHRQVKVEHPIFTTPGGVQYQDILEGLGPEVTMDSEVTLDYSVTLVDTTVIDSTFQRGLPETFQMLDAPLPGWQEALLGMRAGGRRVAEIPSELAYGSQGIEDLVPPNAVLVCEFEMLEVGNPRPFPNASPVPAVDPAIEGF